MSTRGYWTPKLIAKEVKKYTSKREFDRKSSGASKAAKRLGVYEQVTSHLYSKEKFSDKELKKIALKYNTRREFRESKDSNAFWEASRRRIISEICSHMIFRG